MARNDKRAAAQDFAKNWKGRGYERGDAQVFWAELLRDVVGIGKVSSACRFEYRTASGGFIDCLIPDAGVIIEQKGLGVDLDKPEERQGCMVTPFQQALGYAESFPRNCQPRFIVVCNFETFRVHDRDVCPRAELAANFIEFTLDDLGQNPHLIDFISNPENSRAERERQVSMEAGRLIGELHTMLQKQYIDPESEESQKALNILCVRLVFCLFCEDAELFPKDAFLNYLRNVDPSSMRMALKRLFRALDTPVSERDPYDESIKLFPYVNGGLFAEDSEIPNFTEDIKFKLLFEVSQQTDWSQISPTIFGGIFESTLNPETRHAGGMHYTSPENIHKVIDPLFLDGLREEFDSIRLDEGLTPKKRKNALRKFHEKISSLTFFDPACGSGNFLTETYLCLRELEDDVLNDLNGGQVSIGFDFDFESGKDDDALVNTKRVSLDQFFGIEINDFAASVANTALWIAQLQANRRSEMIFSADIDDFPLKDHAHIREGNALRADWNEVLPAAECDYVMGNPPFLGYSNLNDEQKADRAEVFGKAGGTFDYVACWYKRAADYAHSKPSIRCAFVSTNSICQGQQVEPLWKPLFNDGIHIDFAWPSFVWASEASDMAHVHVVIVGFSRANNTPKRIFTKEESREVGNINGYLAPAANVFVGRRGKPLCNVEPMVRGCQPTDAGNFLLWQDECEQLEASEPNSAQWVRPFSMGAEFINGKKRYCLWLKGITPKQLKEMPAVAKRVEAVRETRLKSSKAATRKKADTPWLFDEIREPNGTYIGVPKVSSERRDYIPMGFVDNGMIPGDKLYFIASGSLYVFGIMMSQMHCAWMRAVAGRLEMRYSYANTIVYNNFIWPGAAKETLATPVQELVSSDIRERIETCAQSVLDARVLYPDSSLADLYDPDCMPIELRRAHHALDVAVEAAYGVNFDGDEEKIVAHLFKLYADLTKEQ